MRSGFMWIDRRNSWVTGNPQCKRSRLLSQPRKSNLTSECYGQTNPKGRARLTRRLIMDLVFIVISETEYGTGSLRHIVRGYAFGRHTKTCNLRIRIP